MYESKKSLQNQEKVQCLSCLSTKQPTIENNRVICSECGSPIQTYINMSFVSAESDHPRS